MAKILLVEDSRTVNTLILNFLSQFGFEVQSCYAAEEAIGILEKDKFDLVITDLIMPGMDGMEFIDHVKQTLGATAPRIMAISGGSKATVSADTALECVQASADRVLQKPFSKDDLLNAVSALV